MDCNLKHLQSYRLQLSIFDGPMMLQVNLPIVDRINSKGNYSNCSLLWVGSKVKDTGDSKLNDSCFWNG